MLQHAALHSGTARTSSHGECYVVCTDYNGTQPNTDCRQRALATRALCIMAMCMLAFMHSDLPD